MKTTESVKGEITEVKWNHEAQGTNKHTAFVHVKTDSGARLTIEVERSRNMDEWKVSVRRQFEVRVRR